VAYQSSERGQTDVYVQPFPATGRIFQISRNGGVKPVWRRDGTELFYLAPAGRLMTVSVEATDTFRAGAPKELFSVSTRPGGIASQYAVSRDGQRFLVSVLEQRPADTPLTVVIDWLSEVRQ
jgi:hypothetical protein